MKKTLVEIPMPAAMPCKTPINSSGENLPQYWENARTKYACVVDADEKHETKARRSWTQNLIRITLPEKGILSQLCWKKKPPNGYVWSGGILTRKTAYNPGQIQRNHQECS